MYRVEITDQDEESGAFRTNTNLVIAICQANRAADGVSPTALVVGVLAWSIATDEFTEKQAKAARELIELIGVPFNMEPLIALADME